MEDVGIVLGQALDEALGDRAGIRRYGSALVPMDESLAECAIDISGRPLCVFDADLPTTSIAGFDTELAEEFFRAVANSAKLTLHVIGPLRQQRPPHDRGLLQGLRPGAARGRLGRSRRERRALDQGDAERMTARICILDYGMGNLRSVEKALEHVGATATIANDAETVRAADGVILPGVGAFPKAMERVRELGLDELIAERRDAGVPILGICLGLQLLFDSTTELGGASGIGLLPGGVAELNADGLKVPHIGWSPVRWEKESRLAEGIESETPFYFVHSFAPSPEPRRSARQRRLRRPLRLRGGARQRLRRPVPPREVERRRPAAALQLRRGLRPPAPA